MTIPTQDLTGKKQFRIAGYSPLFSSLDFFFGLPFYQEFSVCSGVDCSCPVAFSPDNFNRLQFRETSMAGRKNHLMLNPEATEVLAQEKTVYFVTGCIENVATIQKKEWRTLVMFRRFSFVASLILCGAVVSRGIIPVPAATAVIQGDLDNPRIRFATEAIERALKQKKWQVRTKPLSADEHADLNIIISVDPAASAPELHGVRREGYYIDQVAHTCRVMARDDAGAMYGGLELAELIATNTLARLKSEIKNPYFPLRGIKFNIPLDARSPTYSDYGDSPQRNIGDMWDMSFWKRCIDNLARARYNFISLWNLHPFPSLVKVPEYPDIALADVKRLHFNKRIELHQYYRYTSEGGREKPENLLSNLETLKKMSIEEKIAFWREVMSYARTRNITFFIVTWNIFTNGTYGKYGITEKSTNPKTVDYFRKSVRQLLLTYPDLGGIGVTAGEKMRGLSKKEREKWLFSTYGMGVLDALERQPQRKILFIHRQHQTGAKDVVQAFEPLIRHPGVEFCFSFKYAVAHIYSCTSQPYHERFIEDIRAFRIKTFWTLRNDDVYYFRWGAPDYVREFIRNIPYDVSRGYYLGSDGYTWGREFLSTEPDHPRRLEIEKHWYHWLLWGRLGYDPGLSNDRFRAILEARFPQVPAKILLTAWQEASMVYPLVTAFHWGPPDFQWYIEGCQGRTGFHDVNDFITRKPHKRCPYLAISDFAAQSRHSADKKSPLQLADEIKTRCQRVFGMLRTLDSPTDDKELRRTLGDLRIIACMGMYYAHKIKGAAFLARYRTKKEEIDREQAIRQLNEAAHWWRMYVSHALTQYTNPMETNRVLTVDWRKTMENVLNDIRIAGGVPQLKSMEPTPGGKLYHGKK
ncbi:MAG: hypothetical protein D6820_09340, partial [Lentisphaerae bacterium]